MSYIQDKVGIPLTGTEVGNPVTGPLKIIGSTIPEIPEQTVPFDNGTMTTQVIPGYGTVVALQSTLPFLQPPPSSLIITSVNTQEYTFNFAGIDNGNAGYVYIGNATIVPQTITLPVVPSHIGDAELILDLNESSLTDYDNLSIDSTGRVIRKVAGIPLTGTDENKPLTGSIKTTGGKTIQNLEDYNNGDSSIVISSQNTENSPTQQSSLGIYRNQISLSANDGVNTCYMVLAPITGDGLGSTAMIYINTVNPNGSDGRGLEGLGNFMGSLNDFSYVQRIYVGQRGTAILVSGTVTVSFPNIKTGAKIFVSVNTPSGTQGFLSAPTSSIVNNTSFVINSSSNTDTSSVNWWIVNP